LLLRAQPIRWSLQMPLVSAIDHSPFPCGHLVWLPDAPMPANQPTIEKVPVPCDRCHGTGINAGIECSECGGKGHRVVIGGKMAAPTKPPERRKRWRGASRA
jgi:hypothetical protein